MIFEDNKEVSVGLGQKLFECNNYLISFKLQVFKYEGTYTICTEQGKDVVLFTVFTKEELLELRDLAGLSDRRLTSIRNEFFSIFK